MLKIVDILSFGGCVMISLDVIRLNHSRTVRCKADDYVYVCYFRMFRDMRPFLDIQRLQERLPRRIVRDRLDPFHAMFEEEFLSRFRFSKQAARDLIDRVTPQLPQPAENSQGVSCFQKALNCT